MKKFVVLSLFLCCLACTLSKVQAQTLGGQWYLIHDGGLDTLTGVSADSVLREVDLQKSVTVGPRFSPSLVPRRIMIVTEFADISNGEGVIEYDAVGENSNNFYDGYSTRDTIATSPAAADVFEYYDIITNPGNAYKYALKQYASAADTDTMTVRRRIFGIY